MSKKLGITILACSTLAILLSICAIVLVFVKGDSKKAPNYDTQYVLYLGTNDKDTNLPVYSKEEAKEKLIEILIEYFGGYTIQEANGGWKDGDVLYTEYTLVIYLSDTSIEEVHSACDKMIEVFRQSSVLIQANQTLTEFYSG